MLKDITIGQYIPGESLLHRSDPRVKIILTLSFMTILFTMNSYTNFLMNTLFIIMVIISSGIPVKYTIKGLRPVLLIVMFTAVINMFTVKGTVLLNLGFASITYEGLSISIKMALRLSLLVVSASLLTLTTTPIALTDGLEKLMGPLKKLRAPVHEIAMMMTIALRFIPTLMEETDKIMKAQAARGADFDTGNLMKRAKSFIPVLVPLFISAFRRADELATAMEARCYRGSEGRTRMKQLRLGRADFYVSAVMMVYTAGLLYVEFFI